MSETSASLALVGGEIYASPTEEPIQDGVVVIQNGIIQAVGGRASTDTPPKVRTLDCSGLTITAGFWNSHVHFFERKWMDAAALPASELSRQLRDMLLQYGFTSVFDTGSPWENTRKIRDRIESGEVAGPRIRSTGEAIIARDALPPEIVFRLMGLMTYPTPEITQDTEAAAASKALLDAGVDAIKLHLQAPQPPAPPFPESAMAAAASEARRAGRPVFVHPNTADDILAAVRAGADVIAHTTPSSGPWSEALLKTMKDAGAALTPTLTLWKFFMRHDRVSVQEGVVQAAIAQLKAWHESRGTVLYGSDLGAVDYDPSDEYALMQAAGMSFRQILTSLTTAPAEQFGDSERLGRVAAGLRADLVLLSGDPADDIRALADVRYTVRDGEIIYGRAATLPAVK